MITISNTQTVTMSFFRYRGMNKIWGMKQMYSARAPMRKMKGLHFYKPLGSGSGVGYSIWPDWSVYGMLAVWDNLETAQAFLNSPLFKDYQSHSTEQYTVFLKPISSRGAWSGFDGWQFSDPNPDSKLVAALTRATLKTRFLVRFWKMVPRVSNEHRDYKGLIFTKGVGEIPLMEQATFSIWSNVKDMEDFAYNTFHGEAVKITRANQGFKEEMFTRLKPFASEGTWKGADPLAPYLAENKQPQFI
jgi:spheroidene monooxygenase